VHEQQQIAQALQLLAKRCPRLIKRCYWAGTSAIDMEELGHRRSFDLDFHTKGALEDVRPILAEMQAAFPGKIEVIQAPDEFGSGFRVLLSLPKKVKITVEVLSNFENVPAREITDSRTVSSIKRVTLRRYLADKIQCVAERAEARDLVDVGAVLRQRPELEPLARSVLRKQDALLLAERLLSWSEESIENDLAAYPDVDPRQGMQTRNLLLRWLKEDSNRSA
jgi:hypothetical protein